MSSQLKFVNPNGHKPKQPKPPRFIRTEHPIPGVRCRPILPPPDPEADRIRNVIRDSMDFNRNRHVVCNGEPWQRKPKKVSHDIRKFPMHLMSLVYRNMMKKMAEKK